jgi:hypothetical protein
MEQMALLNVSLNSEASSNFAVTSQRGRTNGAVKELNGQRLTFCVYFYDP